MSVNSLPALTPPPAHLPFTQWNKSISQHCTADYNEIHILDSNYHTNLPDKNISFRKHYLIY